MKTLPVIWKPMLKMLLWSKVHFAEITLVFFNKKSRNNLKNLYPLAAFVTMANSSHSLFFIFFFISVCFAVETNSPLSVITWITLRGNYHSLHG